MYCYVEFGSSCPDGVEVEFSWLNVQPLYDGDYDEYDQTWGMRKTGCGDTVHFEWNAGSRKNKDIIKTTDGQCGCLGGYDHETCVHGRDSNDGDYVTYFQFETEKPKHYEFLGKDHKLVLRTSGSHGNGRVDVDWKCLANPANSANVGKRLDKLQGKVLDVVEELGWDSSSPFYGRLENKLKRVSKSALKKLESLVGAGCDFPSHWDWKAYQESLNGDRYNRDDPCMAIDQLFTGYSRWLQIYTKDCNKRDVKQLLFAGAKSIQLNKLRDKIFVNKQCTKQIKKYQLEDCEEGWSKHFIGDSGKAQCFKQIIEGSAKSFRLDQAASKCAEYGAKLPLPKSEAENYQIYDVIKGYGVTSAAINANDVENEGEFVDSDGNPLVWAGWSNGNPNNWLDKQHWAYYLGNSHWDDTAGDAKKPLICVKDL